MAAAAGAAAGAASFRDLADVEQTCEASMSSSVAEHVRKAAEARLYPLYTQKSHVPTLQVSLCARSFCCLVHGSAAKPRPLMPQRPVIAHFVLFRTFFFDGFALFWSWRSLATCRFSNCFDLRRVCPGREVLQRSLAFRACLASPSSLVRPPLLAARACRQ
jgi:hypothetical protein